MKQDKYINTSLSKALRVLDLFQSERQELSLSEAAKLLNAKPGGVFPILYTLQQHGYLTRDPKTKRFVVQLKILSVMSSE